MVRQKTIEKYIKINNLLNQGKMNNRQISKEVGVSLRDVHKWVIPNDTIDTNKKVSKGITVVSQKMRSTNPNPTKKKTVDLTIPVYLNEILLSYGKQYGRFEDKSSEYKYEERMRRMKLVEEDLTKRYGMDFNYVLQRKMDRELKLFDNEIRKHNGDH